MDKLAAVYEKKSIRANTSKIKELVPDLKVVYTDIDGTLVGPGGCFFRLADRSFSTEPAETLIRAIQAGIDVVPVSGRNVSQILHDSRMLGLKNYIAEMGAAIVHDLHNITCNFEYADSGNGQTIYQQVEKTGAVKDLINNFAGYLEYHEPWSADRDFTAVLRGSVDVNQANAFLANYPFKLQFVDNGKIDRISPTLKVTETHAYHVIPYGVSKSSAVKKDIEMRRISKNTTIALGDAATDLDFADEVGAFFLVKNGFEANPELADRILQTDNIFITEHKMGLGWAEVIKLFLS